MKNKNNKKRSVRFSLFDNVTGNIPEGNITYIIAFIIPLIILIALYYVREIFPFGQNCYLRSDMYHQYAPFFSELWHKIRNGEMLTYSWDIGMGTNFTSLYAYYLASPVNWFIALFPQKYMIEIMNAIIILKMSAASLTFCYYISKHFNTKKCTIALFGVFYSLCGFLAAYSWNIMWLDCVLLLPLIMLGLEKLVKENKCFLYCISLGICIYTNYYISIMVCISVVIYFVVLLISYDGVKKPVIYFKKCVLFAFYSLIAGGLAACLLLPEIYTFSLSASSTITFPKTFTAYFSMLEMLIRHLINVPVHLGLDHYPNIFCGVAVFILIPLYIMDRKINAREKIGKCVITLIFLLAFNINQYNFIWHGFHFPNSLPCRQSFIYIFFLLTMCYEAFHHIKLFSKKQFAGAVWFAIIFLVLTEHLFRGNEKYNFLIFYISGAFILIYALLLYLNRTMHKYIPALLLAALAVVVVENTINMESTGLSTTGRTNYLLDYNAVNMVTDEVKALDDSFYRMDKITGARTKNDGAWHNYHSISTFSSTSNAGISKLFENLGIISSFNAYGYDGSTMVTNSLFGVKYLISNKHLAEDNLRSYLTGHDGEFVYQNNYTLPVGYLVSSSFKDSWKPDKIYNGIENQNFMIKHMTGVDSVFTLLEEYRTDTDVTFTPKTNGHIYMIAANSNLEAVGVTINSNAVSYSDLDDGRRIIDLGYLTTNDIVEINGSTSLQLSIYQLNEVAFKQAYEILNTGGYNVESWSDTSFKGTVNAEYDGTFLMSIPFDGGWSVYIDGKKAETYAIQDALLAVDMKAGTHTVTLKYMPVNLISGCIITLLCIIILIAIYLLKRYINAGKLNTSKLPPIISTIICEQDIIIGHPANNKISQKNLNALTEEMNDFDNIEIDSDDDTLSDKEI